VFRVPSSKISPGWGFIEQVEDLLFAGARAGGLKDVVIGESYDSATHSLASAAVPGFHSRNRSGTTTKAEERTNE